VVAENGAIEKASGEQGANINHSEPTNNLPSAGEEAEPAPRNKTVYPKPLTQYRDPFDDALAEFMARDAESAHVAKISYDDLYDDPFPEEPLGPGPWDEDYDPSATLDTGEGA
jgi:hypothetical protein